MGGGANIILILLLFAPSLLSAQTCDPHADFTFSAATCNITFSPTVPDGEHTWTFYNDAAGSSFPSITDAVNPTHTFNAGTVLVRHTVVINGSTFVCEKIITLSGCSNGHCGSYYFNYSVDGCTVTITQIPPSGGPVTWDFGDGSPIVTGNTPSHTYSGPGVYIVQISLNGKPCSLPITVDCAGPVPCCSSAFMATVEQNCARLDVKLTSECKSGYHIWHIESAPGSMLLGFDPNAIDPEFQLTNINTSVNNTLIVKHTIVCPGGQSQEETQVIPIEYKGIFIGRDGAVSSLNAMTALPGNQHNGSDGIPVFVTGTITIDKAFVFSSTDIQFHPGMTGFDIPQPNEFFLTDASTLRAATTCDCLWRGLSLSKQGRLRVKNGTSIEDALFGISVTQPVAIVLDVTQSFFRKNFIGIKANNTGQLAFSSTANPFHSNTFDGTGPLKEICTLESELSQIEVNPVGNSYNSPFLVSPAYRTSHSFAGMHFNRCSKVIFLETAIGTKNVFTNMANGMMFYDSDVQYTRNSTFSNCVAINPPIVGYGNSNAAAIAFYDRTTNGPNTFVFNGHNGQGINDIANCTKGIYLGSRQNAGPTKVRINSTAMEGVHHGIYLDARNGMGAFFGNIQDPQFTGVSQNNINASLEVVNFKDGIGGIAFFDWSPSKSNIEIYDNKITVSNSEDFGATTNNFVGSAGIDASGNLDFSDVGNINEFDIHDNRVILEGNGEIGISTSDFPNGVIRNNRNQGGNGNGIFGNSVNLEFGLATRNGRRNKLLCNEVTVTANPNNIQPNLLVQGSVDNTVIGNEVEGPGTGALFLDINTNTNFRCNTFRDNTTALIYDIGASTGAQGANNPPVSFGNRWLNSAGPSTAIHLSPASSLLSNYYVRTINNERPDVVLDGGTQWFLNIPNSAPVDCQVNCPAPSQLTEPPIATAKDLEVADANFIAEGNYPEERTWKARYDLYRKMLDYPELANQHPVLQGFITDIQNTSIQQLWDAQVSFKTLLNPDNGTLNILGGLGTQRTQILSDLTAIGAAIATETDALVLQNLYTQYALKDSLLVALDHGGQTQIAEAWKQQRNINANALVNTISTVFAETQSATNLKAFYSIMLQSLAMDAALTTAMHQNLVAIAEQCPISGGPAVYMARHLLADENLNFSACESNRERTGEALGTRMDMAVLPNPSTGVFQVLLASEYIGQRVSVQVVNPFGQVTHQQESILGQQLRIDLTNAPNGLYLLKVSANGRTVGTEQVILYR